MELNAAKENSPQTEHCDNRQYGKKKISREILRDKNGVIRDKRRSKERENNGKINCKCQYLYKSKKKMIFRTVSWRADIWFVKTGGFLTWGSRSRAESKKVIFYRHGVSMDRKDRRTRRTKLQKWSMEERKLWYVAVGRVDSCGTSQMSSNHSCSRITGVLLSLVFSSHRCPLITGVLESHRYHLDTRSLETQVSSSLKCRVSTGVASTPALYTGPGSVITETARPVTSPTLHQLPKEKEESIQQ